MLGGWLSNFNIQKGETYYSSWDGCIMLAIERCRNHLILFENCKYTSFMQATFVGAYATVLVTVAASGRDKKKGIIQECEQIIRDNGARVVHIS